MSEEKQTQTSKDKSCSALPYVVAVASVVVATWFSGLFNDYIPKDFSHFKRDTITVMDTTEFMDKYNKIAWSFPDTTIVRQTTEAGESLNIETEYVYGSKEEAENVKMQHIAMFANFQGQYGLNNPVSLTMKKPNVIYIDNSFVEEKGGKWRVMVMFKYQHAVNSAEQKP